MSHIRNKTYQASLLAFGLLGLVSISSKADAAICFGDSVPDFPDDTVAGIASSGDVAQYTKWLSFFKKSYLDGVPVGPQTDEWLPSSPQGKWSNAAFVIEYGIKSDDLQVQTPGGGVPLESRPWHASTDYARNAKAKTTLSHFNFTPRYSADTIAVEGGYVLGLHHSRYHLFSGYREQVTTYCPLYDAFGTGLSHPVWRASALVHEGQHSHDLRYLGKAVAHQKCYPLKLDKSEDRSQPSFDCDPAVIHSRYAYAEGELYRSNERAYQLDYEFTCDLAEHANSWVPSDVRLLAQWVSIARKRTLKGGDALPDCGNPYPLGRKNAEKPRCAGTNGCQCADGMTLCGEQCIDLASNDANCGACGNVCHGTCAAGVCTPAPACTTQACDTVADCNGYYLCTNNCCAEPKLN